MEHNGGTLTLLKTGNTIPEIRPGATPGYIMNLLIKFEHPRSTKPRLSLRKCLQIAYGAKAQLTPTAHTSEQLALHQKCRIQEIVGSLLYYA
jgi:hypothetical protein